MSIENLSTSNSVNSKLNKKIQSFERSGFSNGLAIDYGLFISSFLDNIYKWMMYNLKHNQGIEEGKVWTFESLELMQSYMPWFSVDQLRRLKAKCIDEGLIIIANHNKRKYDQTLWYTLTSQAIEYYPDLKLALQLKFDINPTNPSETLENTHMAKSPNGSGEIAEPIPIVKINSKKKIIKDLSPSPKPRAKKSYDCPYFNQFYESYPRKADKAEAAKEFERLTKEMSEKEKENFVDKLKKDCILRLVGEWADGKKYIPYPHRYLKHKKFENDIIPKTELSRETKTHQQKLDHHTTDWLEPIIFPSERQKSKTDVLEQGNIYDA